MQLKTVLIAFLVISAIVSAGIGGTVFSDSVMPAAMASDDDIDTLPPVKQVAMGVNPEDVTCQGERVLLIKINGDPICVMQKSSERLIAMGIASIPEPRSDDVDGDSMMQATEFDVDVSKLVVSMTRLSDTFDVMKQEVMDVTADAVTMYDADGMDAFETITDGAATYDATVPYQFVVDFDTMEILAHGYNPDRVGADGTAALETGKMTIGEIKEELESDGSTWVMYTTTNPENGKEQMKKSYMTLHDGYVFGSGFYLSDLEAEMIVAHWVANSVADMYDKQGIDLFDAINMDAMDHDGSSIYAFVGDIDTGMVVAHGADAEKIGQASTILAGNANKMVDQILAESEANGGTWATYEFTNFETGEDGFKVSWLTVRDNYLIGAGFYPDEHLANKANAIMSTDMALAMYAASGEDAFEEITALNVKEDWYPFVFGYEDRVEYADGSVLDRTGALIWGPHEHNASFYGIRDALEAGHGAFTTYVFLNPDTGQQQAKKSWYVLHDGYVFGAGIYLEDEYADRAAAKWSATTALLMYAEDGQATLDMINEMQSTDETYPFVLDSEFVVVANGANEEYVGMSLFDLVSPDKDMDQILADFRRSETATSWITYEFVHPETGEVDQPKTTILRMYDDGHIFGAGYYPEPES